MTLKEAPMALGGKFDKNLALTTPFLPWALVTLPQIAFRMKKDVITLYALPYILLSTL